jgi:hypothetical protein
MIKDMNGNVLAVNDRVCFMDQRPGRGGSPHMGRILEIQENGWCTILHRDSFGSALDLAETRCPAHRLIRQSDQS